VWRRYMNECESGVPDRPAAYGGAVRKRWGRVVAGRTGRKHASTRPTAAAHRGASSLEHKARPRT